MNQFVCGYDAYLVTAVKPTSCHMRVNHMGGNYLGGFVFFGFFSLAGLQSIACDTYEASTV